MLDLSEIYEIIQWSESNNKDDGKHIGIFITVPRHIAKQFPKKSEDNSPPHCTVLFIGSFNKGLESKLIQVIENVSRAFKPFIAQFGPKVKTFSAGDDGVPVYSPVKSSKLKKLHETLKNELIMNQIQVDNEFPEYKPHITIGYAKNNKEKKYYKSLEPQGEFEVKGIWLWGLDSPKYFLLGRK